MANVKIIFKRNADYKSVPVSGIWGSVTPQGMINGDIFVESIEPPEFIVLDIDQITGEPKTTKKHPEKQDVLREAIVGLVFKPDIARSIGEWLIAKADEVEKRKTDAAKATVSITTKH
jgi:hypothetical protein